MVRVSVITPTHGRVKSFLPACVESVARQRLLPGWELEHVVCSDDDSDEDYAALLVLARGYPHVVVTRNMRDIHGVSAGRNQAFLLSTGDVIIDLDDDDVLPSTSVRDRVTHLMGSHAGWSFGGMLKMTEECVYKVGCDRVGAAPVGQEDAMEAFLGSRLYAWSGTRTYRRSALLAAGPWDESFVVAEDLEHWLRLTAVVGAPDYCDAWLTLFREKDHSLGVNALRSGLMQSEGDKARARWAAWGTMGVPLGLPSWEDVES